MHFNICYYVNTLFMQHSALIHTTEYTHTLQCYTYMCMRAICSTRCIRMYHFLYIVQNILRFSGLLMYSLINNHICQQLSKTLHCCKIDIGSLPLSLSLSLSFFLSPYLSLHSLSLWFSSETLYIHAAVYSRTFSVPQPQHNITGTYTTFKNHSKNHKRFLDSP